MPPKTKLILARVWRILRQWPACFWDEFWAPLWNSQQLLAFLLVTVTAIQIYLYGSISRRIQSVDGVMESARAFGWVLLIWFIVSAIRAPFIIAKQDRELGTWYENRFVFFSPYLISTFRCQATGQIEMYRFKVPFVEPGCFIEYSLELDPDVRARAKWGMGGVSLTGVIPAEQWPGTGGILLPPSRDAIFQLQLEPQTVSTTARIYCRSLTLGGPNETDGTPGNYQFPPRGHD